MRKRKHVLVLTPRFPYPVIGGDRLRIAHLCRALSASFDLSLLSLCDCKEDMRTAPEDRIFREIHRVYLPRWRSYLNTALALPKRIPLQLAYYRSEEFRSLVAHLLPRHDAVLAHLIRMGQYIKTECGVPRILEMTDAISLNYHRLSSLNESYSWKNRVYRTEQNRLFEYEHRITNSFDRLWLVSKVDQRYLTGQSAPRCVQTIPNGVDVDRLKPRTHTAGNVIVFIGNMESVQNQDACHYFAREILPRIHDEVAVRFRVVGNASARTIRSFRSYPHVEITGPVKEIEEGLENAFCGVCPVRAGAGMQNKVLEYMALGLPCVTSEIGLEGIEAVAGKHLLVYSDAQAAVEHIVRLHSQEELRSRLAKAGRALVCERYRWDAIYRRISDSVRELLEDAPMLHDMPQEDVSAGLSLPM